MPGARALPPQIDEVGHPCSEPAYLLSCGVLRSAEHPAGGYQIVKARLCQEVGLAPRNAYGPGGLGVLQQSARILGRKIAGRYLELLGNDVRRAQIIYE